MVRMDFDIFINFIHQRRVRENATSPPRKKQCVNKVDFPVALYRTSKLRERRPGESVDDYYCSLDIMEWRAPLFRSRRNQEPVDEYYFNAFNYYNTLKRRDPTNAWFVHQESRFFPLIVAYEKTEEVLKSKEFMEEGLLYEFEPFLRADSLLERVRQCKEDVLANPSRYGFWKLEREMESYFKMDDCNECIRYLSSEGAMLSRDNWDESLCEAWEQVKDDEI